MHKLLFTLIATALATALASSGALAVEGKRIDVKPDTAAPAASVAKAAAKKDAPAEKKNDAKK